MKPPIAKTVSALRVFIPIAKEIPDQAKPKKATVNKISIIPGTPVAYVTPTNGKNDNAIIMID